jgi:hypothetical protein
MATPPEQPDEVSLEHWLAVVKAVTTEEWGWMYVYALNEEYRSKGQRPPDCMLELEDSIRHGELRYIAPT